MRPPLVLGALLVGYAHNQLSRFLPTFLSAVAVPACQGAGKPCSDSPHVSGCDPCPANGTSGYWEECDACKACLGRHDAGRVNLLDGACVSSAEYGLLSGYAFAGVFSVCVLIAGRFADVFPRKRTALAALVLWSGAIALHGVSRDFAELAGARALLGLAQAFYTPAAYALLADLFDPALRARANSIFALGVYVGCAGASLCILAAPAVGWRGICLATGAAGGPLAALLLCVVREPPRAAALHPASATPGRTLRHKASDGADGPLLSADGAGGDASGGAEPGSAWRALLSVLARPTLVAVTAASALRFAGGFAVAAYLPIAFRRAFPAHNAAFGVANAVIVAVGGSASSQIGGAAASAWADKWAPAEAAVPALSSLLALAPLFVLCYAERFETAVGGLAVFFLLGEGWLGSALASVQRFAPRGCSGLAVSLLLFAGSAVGNASPAVMGALDDGTARIRHLLFLVAAASYASAAVVFAGVAAATERATRLGSGGGGGEALTGTRRDRDGRGSGAVPSLSLPQEAPPRPLKAMSPLPDGARHSESSMASASLGQDDV